MKPKNAVSWNRGNARGNNGTREFRGQNPDSGVALGYVLGQRARQVEMKIFDVTGTLVREFEDAGTDSGLHVFRWDLRRQATTSRGRRGGFRRGGPAVSPGVYLVKLTVDGDTQQTTVNVVADPDQPSDRVAEDEELESWLEFLDED